jgi:AcrR family transcriptional regulator
MMDGPRRRAILDAIRFRISVAYMKLDAARRSYRQGARAVAAQETAERIVQAFLRRLGRDWFDEIRLEDVARDAAVTVQTVIRRFGGKEGLLDAAAAQLGVEIRRRREVTPGDVAALVEALIEDYETVGDLVIRTLAQDARYPALRRATDLGRREHRAWLAAAFAPQLGPDAERDAAPLDALVAATDVYLWQLVRRDLGRSTAELRRLMTTFIHSALAGAPSGLPSEARP